MEVAASYRFDAPPPAVWAVLMDPAALQRCMPGCESLESLGDGEYQAVVNLGLGLIRGRYNAKIALRDARPPQFLRLVVDGSGALGFARGEATVTLTAAEGKTTAQVASQGQAGGPAARVGQRMMESAARGMLDKFFAGLQAEVNREVHDAAGPTGL